MADHKNNEDGTDGEVPSCYTGDMRDDTPMWRQRECVVLCMEGRQSEEKGETNQKWNAWVSHSACCLRQHAEWSIYVIYIIRHYGEQHKLDTRLLLGKVTSIPMSPHKRNDRYYSVLLYVISTNSLPPTNKTSKAREGCDSKSAVVHGDIKIKRATSQDVNRLKRGRWRHH